LDVATGETIPRAGIRVTIHTREGLSEVDPTQDIAFFLDRSEALMSSGLEVRLLGPGNDVLASAKAP
jgi:hypothetical protein